MAAIPAQGGFLERTRTARKVMVLDLGFLGDTVHLLPALWMVRQAYPKAELHAAVADHIVSLMACVPWVDRAWGYARFPKHATLRQNLQMVGRLRRERFDVLINLNGSDRSSWLSFLSGAWARLGRQTPEWRTAVLGADVHRVRQLLLVNGASLRPEMPLPGASRLPFQASGVSSADRSCQLAGCWDHTG